MAGLRARGEGPDGGTGGRTGGGRDGRTGGRRDGRTGGRTDGRTDARTDGRTGGNVLASPSRSRPSLRVRVRVPAPSLLALGPRPAFVHSRCRHRTCSPTARKCRCHSRNRTAATCRASSHSWCPAARSARRTAAGAATRRDGTRACTTIARVSMTACVPWAQAVSAGGDGQGGRARAC